MSAVYIRVQSAARRGSRRSIYVRGVGDSETCGSDAGLRDSWIFLLHVVDDVDSSSSTQLRLNSSLIRITLTNIDRIESLVGDQPTRLVDRHRKHAVIAHPE